MRAVVVIKPNQVAIVDYPMPEIGPYEALIQTKVACLCNATDGKLVAGHFPGVDQYPLMLGHESCGVVVDKGEKVRNFQIGQKALGGLVCKELVEGVGSGWGGFCEYTIAADHDAMVADGVADAEHGWFETCEIMRPLDDDIPFEEGALLCTWREVYGGIGDFQIKPTDDLLIFGAGPVGLSFTKFTKLMGLKYVAVVDPLQAKRNKALEMGADEVFGTELDALKALCEKRGKKFDVIVDAVGSPKIINSAVELVRMGGTIGVYGVIADGTIPVEKFRGPYNFNLFIHQWPTRFREAAAQKPLCEWVREGKLSANEFLSHEFPIDQITDAMEAVKRGEAIKVLLRY